MLLVQAFGACTDPEVLERYLIVTVFIPSWRRRPGRAAILARCASFVGFANRLFCGAALLLSLGACQTAGGPNLVEIAERVNATLEPNTVVLAVGDLLEVRFGSAPTTDWNQEVTIAPDGSASFLGVGRLVAAGQTVGKLNQTLSDAYSRVMDHPDMALSVKTFGARTVYVMGEVLKPGEFVLTPDKRLTLLEAIARAGGQKKETAYLAHLLLIRWNAATGKQISWKIDAREEHWQGALPLYLQPYDVVYIPNTPVDVVAIWVDNYIRRMIPFPYLFTPVP